MADPEGVRSKSTQAAYTVKIRGEAFELSEEQIRFDSPNYFVSAFFGDWAESTMKEVKLLDRSPKLFREYILDYLSGYTLPFDDIKRDLVLYTNLLRDVQYYSLSRLECILRAPPGDAIPKELESAFAVTTLQDANRREMHLVVHNARVYITYVPDPAKGHQLRCSKISLVMELAEAGWQVLRDALGPGMNINPGNTLESKQSYSALASSTSCVSVSIADTQGTWFGSLLDVMEATRELAAPYGAQSGRHTVLRDILLRQANARLGTAGGHTCDWHAHRAEFVIESPLDPSTKRSPRVKLLELVSAAQVALEQRNIQKKAREWQNMLDELDATVR